MPPRVDLDGLTCSLPARSRLPARREGLALCSNVLRDSGSALPAVGFRDSPGFMPRPQFCTGVAQHCPLQVEEDPRLQSWGAFFQQHTPHIAAT